MTSPSPPGTVLGQYWGAHNMSILRRFIVSLFILIGLCPIASSEGPIWPEIKADELENYTADDVRWFALRCLVQDRFEDLEPLFDRARAEGLLFEDGSPILATLYGSFSGFFEDAVVAVRKVVRERADSWQKEHPDSKTALLIGLCIDYRRAWRIRGGGYASEIPPDKMRKFNTSIQVIATTLEKNRERFADDFYFQQLDLNVKQCGSAPFSEIMKCVERSYALQPRYTDVFTSASFAALPRCSGSSETIYEFAEFTYALTREDYGLACYLRVAAAGGFYEGAGEVVETFRIEPSDIVKGARDFNTHFPGYGQWANNVAAEIVCELEMRDEAKELFDAIGDAWNEGVWTRPMFERYKAWANGAPFHVKSTPLHDYAASGALGKLTKALEGGADPNFIDEQGLSPIFLAAQAKNWDMVRVLLEHGADPNLGYPRSGTPLSLSIRARETALANALLDADADPNVSYGKWHISLINAIHMGPIELLERMASDPDINFEKPFFSRFPALILALSEKRAEAAHVLIRNGADVNSRMYYGYTPLLSATTGELEETVELLLEYGADPRYSNIEDWTPLHRAAKLGNERMVTALLAHELTDVNAVNGAGWTSLHIAATDGIPGVVRMLADDPEIDLDVAHRDTGQTALHYAAEKGSLGCVKWLVEAGADTTLKTNDGQTAADIAAKNGRGRLVKIINGA